MSTERSNRRVFQAGPLIARGDFCDYYASDADGVPCVLKIVCDAADGDLLDREADTLRALWSSPVEGGDHFTRYLPRLVDVTRTADGRAVNVLTSGEGVHDEYYSIEQILAAHPDGLSVRHMVWMGNRMLELLAWVHKIGVVHGALLPAHIMYRPRDHAGMLWNWCFATKLPDHEKLPAMVPDYKSWYPSELLAGRPPMPADDTAMLARCLIQVLGGDPLTGEVPERAFEDERDKDPTRIIELVRSMLPASGLPRHPNTIELRHTFSALAEQVYGPKRFVVLTMPA